MIYLIGGSPRVGKTKLVNYVVREHPMHAVSTDAIRYMLRRTVPKEAISPDIFIHFKTDVLETWSKGSEALIEEQNRQSKALWPFIREFINSYQEDGIDLIVEGVAILPEFVKTLDVPNRGIFLGNASESHKSIVIEQAEQNSHDWMRALPPEKMQRATEFFARLSEYFRVEASAHDLAYQEMADTDFEHSLQSAARHLLG
jgi:2-phosphoglycerate kinase